MWVELIGSPSWIEHTATYTCIVHRLAYRIAKKYNCLTMQEIIYMHWKKSSVWL